MEISQEFSLEIVSLYVNINKGYYPIVQGNAFNSKHW